MGNMRSGTEIMNPCFVYKRTPAEIFSVNTAKAAILNYSEAADKCCSVEKMFRKIPEISKKNFR